MKLCIIFRGETVRPNVRLDKNIENWNATIFNDLKNNNHITSYHIAFITYDSNMIEYLKSEVNPDEVILYLF